MNRKKHSYFKNPTSDLASFKNWTKRLEETNGYAYEQKRIKTSLGDTQIYGFNLSDTDKETLVIPQKIKGAFLLNPGCFRLVSFGFKNLYYNLLPVFKPSRKNIAKFLDNIVFSKPNHSLSSNGEELLIDFLELAINQYKDRTEKPYYMGKQLDDVKVVTFLLVGNKDILIPYEKSVARAKKHLGNHLVQVKVFNEVGHGIECYPDAISFIEETITLQQISAKQ